MNDNEKIIQQISELIPLAPDYWVDIVAAKMGKKRGSIYYYARGLRGVRQGAHKEVLRFLIELVDKEKKRTARLIKASKLLSKPPPK